MLLQILLSSKSIPRTPVAIGIWAHERFLRIRVLLVHLALMSEKAPRVREALDLVTSGFHAFVGSIMLVHVFATADNSSAAYLLFPGGVSYSLPFTRTSECWRRRLTVGVVAVDLTGGIPGGIPSAADRQSRSCSICCRRCRRRRRRRQAWRRRIGHLRER